MKKDVSLEAAIDALFFEVWASALGGSMRNSALVRRATVPGEEPLRVAVSIQGDWSGDVLLSCPRDTALEFAASLLRKPVESVLPDEVESTLMELINIFGGNLKSVLPGCNQLALPRIAPDGALGHLATLLHEQSLDFHGWPLRLQVFAAAT